MLARFTDQKTSTLRSAAIALRTPGCEVGVWPELIGRFRGGEAAASSRPICVAGLHFVDEWEARRARARNLSETA